MKREGVNKSFDVNKMLDDVEKTFEVYREGLPRSEYDYEGEVINIVKGLTDILRADPKRSNNNLSKRVYKIVDQINGRGGTLWSLSRRNYVGEPLMTFLNDLTIGNKFTP